MKKVARAFKYLDLQAWDNWFPLALIGVFLFVAGLVAADIVRFHMAPGQLDRFEQIFIEVGIGGTTGIFGIVVSLSLVAIQYASQEYSHRIMDHYVKSVMFWSTIIVYLTVIILAIVSLTNATDVDTPFFASMVVIGAILALLLLIPHFLITASYLRPEFIIGKLLRRVDTEYLVRIAKQLDTNGGRISSRVDRLLPVVELTERSIDRGDRTTTRSALELLHVTYATHAEPLNNLAIERYFLDYLLRIGRKAVAETDEDEAAVQAIQMIGLVGGKGPAAAISVDAITMLGGMALKSDAEPVVQEMLDSLYAIYVTSSLAGAREGVLTTYRNLVDDLATAEKGRLLQHLTNHVHTIGKGALAQGDLATATRCADTLESIGYNAATRKLFDVVLHVAQKLQAFGIGAVSDHPDIADRVTRSLLRVERVIPRDERDVIAATEFAKGDIEREIARKRRATETVPTVVTATPPGGPSVEAAPAARDVRPSPPDEPSLAVQEAKIEEPEDGDFSDLWGEKKD